MRISKKFVGRNCVGKLVCSKNSMENVFLLVLLIIGLSRTCDVVVQTYKRKTGYMNKSCDEYYYL